ncbi:aldose epimerase [Streptomyces corchorusii]|uniref:Aldose 1-epimerase n=2 Tax=Streptomyces TaxID=1883 RepID=A0A101PRI8_STRCK|nr:aldose epimerase family protein [Streptomyces corchorusii]ALO99407.1 Aldose 1-epimerase [Streptomyces hygroscopicus subsp. limoneus]KUN16128.1 aldose epimerase [Streptomyces corchorusii]
MHARKESVGVTAGHPGQGPRPVDAYELDTGDGLAIVVWTYGATLVEVRVPDRHGRQENVVLRHARLRDYENRRGNPYLGATVGRFCRNIAYGKFTLDGRSYQLDLNDRRHHIHGGSYGFDRVVWDAELTRSADALTLRLRYLSPDGDQGYPGALAAETSYRVEAGGRLTFEHRATTSASTIVGFTNHAYWNLAGSGDGGVIDDHRLRLNATHMLPFDDEFLPVAGPVPVHGTAYDFTTARRLGRTRIDNFFTLSDPAWAAEMSDPASGRRMRVVTDQPGIGLYSADRYARSRAGLCLETGAWPDAANRPEFPSARLDPDGVYTSRTTHHFTVD